MIERNLIQSLFLPWLLMEKNRFLVMDRPGWLKRTTLQLNKIALLAYTEEQLNSDAGKNDDHSVFLAVYLRRATFMQMLV